MDNKIKKKYFIIFTFILSCLLFLLPLKSEAEFSGVGPAEDINPWTPELASSVKFVSVTNAEIVGFAIDSSGYPWTWGFNASGRTGIGVDDGSYLGGMKRIPFFVDNGIKVKSISSSYQTSFAITEDGDVYSWGNAGGGALGTNDKKNNPNPKKIDFPEKIVIVDASDSTASAGVFAVGESGTVYCWGYEAFYTRLLPGVSGNQYVPIVNTMLTKISEDEHGIKQIKIGYDCGLILTGDGNVYGWGTNGYYATGINKPNLTEPTRVDFFEDGEVKEIDVRFQHSLFLKTDGTVYESGYLLGKNKNGTAQVPAQPVPVEIDTSSANYDPIVRELHASKYAGYFIDQHGRSWVWGDNGYYQFMTDGPLTGTTSKEYDYTDPSKGKLSKNLTMATQLPKTMGDGDTQASKNILKAPVFSNVLKTDFTSNYTYGYKYQGVWGPLDGTYPRKHPTIYDKKYYKTIGTELDFATPGTGAYVTDSKRAKAHEQVYMVDADGNKLVYAVIQDSPKTVSGNFYIADSDYVGGWYYENKNSSVLPEGVTSKTSVPEVKESEKGWIGLSTGNKPNDFTGTQNAEIPYIAAMDTYESAVTILDNSGNLYRQSLNGSGNVAWGWDFNPIYDSGSSADAVNQGMYDAYVYEVMFMRGAPRTIPGHVNIVSKRQKHYLSDNEKDKVNIKIGLGAAFTDTQLNITIEPKLNSAKYLIIPYSNTDENIKKTTPSKEEFEEAYASANQLGYTAVDLVEKNGWYDMEQKIGQPEIQLSDDSLEIEKNSVVWAMVETTSYNSTPTVIKSMIFDNFYTDASIKSEGSLLTKPDNIIYDALPDNVAKIKGEGEKSKYGFPIDVNGTIIKDPTFGYDDVQVKKIDNDRLDKLDQKPIFSHRYIWEEQQATDKVYTLNGVDNPQNTPNDIAEVEGELPVSTEFNHKFYYNENPDIYFNLHYVAVDKDGKKIANDEFNLPTETLVMKENELDRTAPSLKINDELVPFKYFINYEKPLDTIGVSDFEKLAANKSVKFTVPYDPKIKDVTLYYLYDQDERYVTLNIRQVVASGSKIEVPKTGYTSYQKANDKWETQTGTTNLRVPSGEQDTSVSYKTVKTKVTRDNHRFILNYTLPQYYKYVGYKESNEMNDNDSAEMISEKEIKVDYSDDSEAKWLTIYLEPTTNSSINYSWKTITNEFGKLFVEKPKQIRVKFYRYGDTDRKKMITTDLETYGGGVLKEYYDNLDDYYLRFNIFDLYKSPHYKSKEVVEDILLDRTKIDINDLPKEILMNYYYTDKEGKEIESKTHYGDHNGITNPNVYGTVVGLSEVKGILQDIDMESDSNELVVWYEVKYLVNIVGFP